MGFAAFNRIACLIGQHFFELMLGPHGANEHGKQCYEPNDYERGVKFPVVSIHKHSRIGIVWQECLMINRIFKIMHWIDKQINVAPTEIESAISIGINMNGAVILASVVLIVFFVQIINFFLKEMEGDLI